MKSKRVIELEDQVARWQGRYSSLYMATSETLAEETKPVFKGWQIEIDNHYKEPETHTIILGVLPKWTKEIQASLDAITKDPTLGGWSE